MSDDRLTVIEERLDRLEAAQSKDLAEFDTPAQQVARAALAAQQAVDAAAVAPSREAHAATLADAQRALASVRDVYPDAKELAAAKEQIGKAEAADWVAPVRATAEAQALAAEKHVDLATVTGSGVDGAVVAADVEAAKAAKAAAKTPA